MCWPLTFIIFLILLVVLYACAEYQSLKKFYPDLTFSEYIILHDRLKVIPTENIQTSNF